MIEIVKYEDTNELKVIAYDVLDMQEKFSRIFEGFQSRHIMQKFGYDVNKLGNSIKLLPNEKRIIISFQQMMQ